MTLVMQKFRQTIIIISIIISILFLLFIKAHAVEADLEADYDVIFNHRDAEKDDFGPGTYQYPQNEIFQNKGNLFDIRVFTILESDNDYLFKFDFTRLTDPWNSKYEFSLPLIELYIDNDQGGSNNPFYRGANISFEEGFSWNKFLKISGWWVRIFNPNSKERAVFNLNEISSEDPYQSETADVSIEDNTINLKISKSELGSLDSSKFVLLIGSFDPFGYDHFRSFSEEKSSWQIYTETELDINKIPRVMDILVPEGRSQREILSEEFAEIPSFAVNNAAAAEKENGISNINRAVDLLFIIYILFVMGIIYYYRQKKY
ncbi:MAG: glucodextranase DOMON-like domain-containing protein [Halanaerobium sp.]